MPGFSDTHSFHAAIHGDCRCPLHLDWMFRVLLSMWSVPTTEYGGRQRSSKGQVWLDPWSWSHPLSATFAGNRPAGRLRTAYRDNRCFVPRVIRRGNRNPDLAVIVKCRTRSKCMKKPNHPYRNSHFERHLI